MGAAASLLQPRAGHPVLHCVTAFAFAEGTPARRIVRRNLGHAIADAHMGGRCDFQL